MEESEAGDGALDGLLRDVFDAEIHASGGDYAFGISYYVVHILEDGSLGVKVLVDGLKGSRGGIK